MALIQITVLFLTTSVHLDLALWLVLPVLAVLSYVVVGTRVFTRIGEPMYQSSLTALIGIFGILLLVST
jgi:hypothetical protein